MRKTKKYLKPVFIGALFIAAYFPTFAWMWQRWMAKDSYYGHGILVPFISGYIAWQILKKEKYLYKPSNAGLILILGGLFIHIISAFMRVYFTSAFSMLITIAGLTVYFAGKNTLKKLAFPYAFLVFMLPLPLVTIANISFKMKLFAAHISTILVNQLGIAAVRAGSLIQMRHSNLMVGDPCSGLRSLIALLALGSLFAYYLNGSRAKKIIMLIASVPIALASNITRIVFLCFVSEVYGAKYSEGLVHDTAGIMVFVLAFIGMAIVSKALE